MIISHILFGFGMTKQLRSQPHAPHNLAGLHSLSLSIIETHPKRSEKMEQMIFPIGSMYGIYANIWGILMVNVTIYSIHGSYEFVSFTVVGFYCSIVSGLLSVDRPHGVDSAS